jgi:hypothetical protein
MASIQPFRALRPTPTNAAAVSSVPYDVITTDEARELAAPNPLSFLHVTRAEIDLPPDTDPYSAPVYAKAQQNLSNLRHDAPLMIEDAPALYFYRLKMGGHVQTGVAGCFSVDEYEQDIIKKHERTRRDKEDDRTRHMVEVRAQTGMVFLTYKASAAIEEIAHRVTRGAPLFDFRAPSARFPHSTSPMAIIVRPALRAYGRSFGRTRPARLKPIHSWRWHSPTRRCGSSLTTGRFGISRARRRRTSYPSCAGAST